MPNGDDLMSRILEKDHGSCYCIHLGSTKCTMTLRTCFGGWTRKEYCGILLQSALIVNKLRPSIPAEFFTTIIQISSWKWEYVNMEFVLGFLIIESNMTP